MRNNIKIQETQKTSSSVNLKKTTPRNILIKFLKTGDKQDVLKTARRKKTCYIQKLKDKNDSRFVFVKQHKQKDNGATS